MPNSDLGQQILAENKALRTDVIGLRREIGMIEDKGRHTRWAVYVLSAVLVGILLGMGWLRIMLIQQYQEDACEAANASRALENKLWTDLITADLALTEAEGIEISDGERAAIEAVRLNVAAAYPQRDCGKVKDGEVVNISPIPSSPPPAP